MTDDPNREAVLEVLRRVTPPEYWEPILGSDSAAIYRALAAVFAASARGTLRSIQSRFTLPHSRQVDEPASGAVAATCTAVFRRTGRRDRGFYAAAGELRLIGFGEREFANATEVRFDPDDDFDVTVELACLVRGSCGNMDFIDEDLLPDGLLELAAEDPPRANVGGSVSTIAGSLVMRDSGRPSVFVAEDVGLYVEITDSSTAGDIGKILKIRGFSSPAVEFPAGSGLLPRLLALENTSRALPGEFIRAGTAGTVFVDQTALAISPTVADVPMTTAPPVADDAIYILSASSIAGVVIDVSTAGDGVWEVVWEYWAGSWQPLDVWDDGVIAFMASGTVSITWEVPAAVVALASPATGVVWPMAVRARFTSVGAVVASPVASRIYATVLAGVTDGTVSWAVRTFADLGVGLVSATPPTGGRDDVLYLLGDSRGVYRRANESDDDFRWRIARIADTVSPNAILRAVNRILAPLGLTGAVIDPMMVAGNASEHAPGGGYDGLFLDVDFLDYGTPGGYAVSLVATFHTGLTGHPIIDGVATSGGMRVLAAGEFVAASRGVYIVPALPGPWSRDPDWGYPARAPDPELRAGSLASVPSLGSLAATSWVAQGTPDDRIGTDGLVFVQDVGAYPETPWKRCLSAAQAYGNFWVLVPPIPGGDQSIYTDDGPSIFVESKGYYVGSFLDSGFLDATASVSTVAMAAIAATVNATRAGGVTYEILRVST